MDLCQIWASYLRNFHNLYFLHCLFCSILVLAWPPLPLYHQKHFASACPRIGIPAPTLSVFSNSQRLKVGTANIVRAVKSSKCSTPALDIWDRGPQGYCRPLNDFRTKWPKTRKQEQKITNSPAFLFIKSCKWWSNVFFLFSLQTILVEVVSAIRFVLSTLSTDYLVHISN